ncbi:MAG: acyl-CoA synthetase [Desulfobacteraceae bacterium]|nr:acetate--CoA ligase family protein [Desulfobacteraceae bacterium]MBC2757712.1 acyl-CoA synthetase [Desulfobacteraceae bacterium]
MSIESILNAESVAIVGASKDPTKRGLQTIRSLIDEKYEGRIYPVNPKEKKILGFPCYKKVSDIEGDVDIALIATPARSVPSVLEDCGQKGVKGAVILAVGFGEMNAAGKALEQEVLTIAKKNNIRLIGPNTSGMMNVASGLNLVGLQDTPKGSIGLLSQSGNMALTLITEARLKSLKGFSYYIGVGNEADIRFHEYLDFFKNDPKTNVILIYVEGMREGRKFLQQAYQTSIKKPIVLLKSGRSLTGQRSAGSHTGALAGMSEVARSAFKRAGIIVIEKSDQLFPVAETLACLPPLKKNKVAILADGGGHATIAADILTDLSIEVPELSEKTRRKLESILPLAASISNPIDIAGAADADPTVFADCAEILLKDKNIYGLLVVGLFGGYGIRFSKSLGLMEEDAAHRMGKLVKKSKKPIIVHSLYGSEKSHPLHLLRYYNIPVYDSLDVAAKCTGALGEYENYLASYHAKTNFVLDRGAKRKPEAVDLINRAKNEGRSALLEHEAKHLVALHGAPVTHDFLAKTAGEAVGFAKNISSSVALKIVSPDILHKSDARGVRVNLRTEKEIRKAFSEIIENAREYKPDADIRGVLVSPMASDGTEVIIGTKIDDQFGPVIMFGIGGIMVEVLKDVAFRVLPISYNSAKKMIREIRSYPILKGTRGNPPGDERALNRLLLTCSEVIASYPEIREMDLNPVIVHEKGISIVDARIIL